MTELAITCKYCTHHGAVDNLRGNIVFNDGYIMFNCRKCGLQNDIPDVRIIPIPKTGIK